MFQVTKFGRLGGGKTICLTTGAATFGIEPLNSLLGGGLIG